MKHDFTELQCITLTCIIPRFNAGIIQGKNGIFIHKHNKVTVLLP